MMIPNTAILLSASPCIGSIDITILNAWYAIPKSPNAIPICPILYHVSAISSSDARFNARSKQPSAISY